jgi:hypothetical protein
MSQTDENERDRSATPIAITGLCANHHRRYHLPIAGGEFLPRSERFSSATTENDYRFR